MNSIQYYNLKLNGSNANGKKNNLVPLSKDIKIQLNNKIKFIIVKSDI